MVDRNSHPAFLNDLSILHGKHYFTVVRQAKPSLNYQHPILQMPVWQHMMRMCAYNRIRLRKQMSKAQIFRIP